MSDAQILEKAADSLAEAAQLHRESCQIAKPNAAPLEWACADCDVATCPAKKRHDELNELADGLRRIAGKG